MSRRARAAAICGRDIPTLRPPEIRQSKINSRSVAGPMGQMNRPPSV